MDKYFFYRDFLFRLNIRVFVMCTQPVLINRQKENSRVSPNARENKLAEENMQFLIKILLKSNYGDGNYIFLPFRTHIHFYCQCGLSISKTVMKNVAKKYPLIP